MINQFCGSSFPSSLLAKNSQFELVDCLLYAVVEVGRHLEGSDSVNIETTLCLSEIHLIVELVTFDFPLLVFVEPLDALAFLPEAALRLLSWNAVGAESVLLTTAPVA